MHGLYYKNKVLFLEFCVSGSLGGSEFCEVFWDDVGEGWGGVGGVGRGGEAWGRGRGTSTRLRKGET